WRRKSNSAAATIVRHEGVPAPLAFGDGLPSGRPNDKTALELSGRFAVFDDLYMKGDSRVSFPGELRVESRQFVPSRTQTNRSNGFAHRSQKSDRAFRDNDMRVRVIQFEPEKAIGSQGRHGVDAAAECSAEMI